MKKFTPIAMKHTQEQFEAVKPKLINCKIEMTFGFDGTGYLLNCFKGTKNLVSNIYYKPTYFKIEIHETWNEKVFLEACGIETTPIEKTYTITGDLIKKIASDGISCHFLMKENYPEVFEEKKTELVAGKWYVYPPEPKFITYVKETGIRFGTGTTGNWFNNSDTVKDTRGYREATDQEVTEALTKEAVKRGFGENVYVKDCGNTHNGEFHYHANYNYLYCGGYAVFVDGEWVTIIEQKPMTQEQIEKELGYKIKIV
jgi:hypothetical protein